MKLDCGEAEGRVAIGVAHGVVIAAAFYGTSRQAMSMWLRTHGVGPIPEDHGRRAPRAFCSCPMCDGVRTERLPDGFAEVLAAMLAESAEIPVDLRREAWMRLGACRRVPEMQRDWFFAPDGFERKDQRVRRELAAKGVCAGCNVRKPCLEYALTNREQFGIWGGMTEAERASSRRTIAV